MLRFPKPKTFRSKPYLAFIRGHKCLICRNPAGIIPHHDGCFGLNMMGGKPPDSVCVPLCLYCHNYMNAIGTTPSEVWEKANIDPKLEIILLLTEYLQERNDALTEHSP